jgi:hypothetical protein
MRDQQHMNAGRSPQRSEAVSGNETKGQTPISAERTIQPEGVAVARSSRPRAKLSLPQLRASKPASGSATPDQA